MRSSIQVSPGLMKRLRGLKRHPRQAYEEVISEALDARSAAASAALRRGPPLPRGAGDVLQRVRSAYGDRLVRLVLYGSHARGDARPDSDVDVLVVLRGGIDRAREIDVLAGIAYDGLLASGAHVSLLPMSEQDFLTRVTPLLLNVRREGIPL